jgi:hypothetical protein
MVKVQGSVITADGNLDFGGVWWINPKLVATIQEMPNKKSLIQMATGLTLLVDTIEAKNLTGATEAEKTGK